MAIHSKHGTGLKYPPKKQTEAKKPKHSDIKACHQCDAVFLDGNWVWADRPTQAIEVLCPACRLIHDRFPAGFVHVSGDYFLRHRDELIHLIETESEKEQSERPLERVMESTQEGAGMVITTTGAHLARRLGEALHRACHGELNFHYSDAENLVRVYWHR